MNAECIRCLLLQGDHMPLLRCNDRIESVCTPVVDRLVHLLNRADDPGLPVRATECDVGTGLYYTRAHVLHIYTEWSPMHGTFAVRPIHVCNITTDGGAMPRL